MRGSICVTIAVASAGDSPPKRNLRWPALHVLASVSWRPFGAQLC